MIGALDRKVLRDLWRLKAQVLAIALVMAAGAATLILATGAVRSLEETRAAYYERNNFADVFARLRRAPEAVGDRIASLPGIAAVETRIVENAVLDIDGMIEPGSARLISIPDRGEARLNRLTLQTGRLPDPSRPDEVVVNEAFAEAHGFLPGDRFGAIVNGRKRELSVAGIALSPEFIYAIGPWDVVPDDRRFAIIWMSRSALAAAFDLQGAFSAVSLRLLRGASEQQVIETLDGILERYGGAGAHGRDQQESHAFVQAEIEQIEALSRVLPPIFLFIAAFLVNITLTRLIALEREQIGLLKAVGYSSTAIAAHYLKFAAVIAVIGSLVGAVAGTWLGRGMTVMLIEFFHFPYLIFTMSPDIYLIAIAVTVLAAGLGALKAVWSVLGLAPAVAMQPPSPPRYRRILPRSLDIARYLPKTMTMIGRNMVRAPVRAGMTVLGMALSVAILIGSLFLVDSIYEMLEVHYFQAERQHATVNFVREAPEGIVYEISRWPGVLAVEGQRVVAARLRNGHRDHLTQITGKPAQTELARALDADHRPLILPDRGIVPSVALADKLGLQRGDRLEVEFLQGGRRTVTLEVTGLAHTYIGLGAFMEIGAVNRAMREGRVISSVNFSLDDDAVDALYETVKGSPMVGAIGLQRISLANFRQTMDEMIWISMSIYVVLAAVIAFGVVYNSARIQLSERARELASLRVLGFTRAEVSWILLGELTILTLISIPLGWLLGYGLAIVMLEEYASDLFRLPFVISNATFAASAAIVLGAAAFSALIVRRRIDRLDLIEVLKTRE
jgi:putative ABC transport system permease protein